MVYKKTGNEKIKERISIFIDGSNFYHNIKKILKEKERINYKKLIDVLVGSNEFIDAIYYVARLDKEVDKEKYEKHEKFLNSLTKISKLKVKLCNLKKIKNNKGKFIYIIKNDDILLAQDLLIGAFDNLYDTGIIVSGDEDFVPVINTLKKRFKKKVINACFRSSSSYRLREVCDYSIKLNKIIYKFIDKRE